MSVEVAETHRKGAYAEIRTIEDILALPTDFARTEALYTLAGRSNPRTVQGLIYQANQIADQTERRAALQILFSRLTELDPPSALALSQTSEYSTNMLIEATVWVEWGRNDIHNALIAAADLDSDSRRHRAAQALYSAFGADGNATIALIEDTLRIPPSRNTKGKYLYSLAADSPAQAIAYIESQFAPQDQRTLTYWLASYLGQRSPDTARQYAELFSNAEYRNTYLNALTNAAAESSPETTLAQMLAEGSSQQDRMRAVAALAQLAMRDPDKAIAYLDQARNVQERRHFALTIAMGMAQSDPDRAMQWALEYDPDDRQHFYADVLAQVAHHYPRRAMDAALTIQNRSSRNHALQKVLMTLAHTDTQLALQYLEQIDSDSVQRSVAQNLVQVWARSDANAAFEWVLARGGQNQRAMLRQITSSLVHQDAQAAIGLLSRLDDESQREMRLLIASTLASQGSSAEAQGFLAQHEGYDDYPQMFAAVVRSMAANDFESALQMTHSLQDGNEKDQLLTALAQQQVQNSPADAMRLIAMISREEQRLSATTQLVQTWNRVDSGAAASWVRDLPRGTQRDLAIVGLASGWDQLTPSRKMLLKSVGDIEQRQRAQLSVIYKVARSDLATAERLVLEFDFSDQNRQMAEQALKQSQYR